MIGENAEKWRQLCAKAAVEQDPRKLFELTQEIIRLLKEKQDRLVATRKSGASSASATWTSSAPISRDNK